MASNNASQTPAGHPFLGRKSLESTHSYQMDDAASFQEPPAVPIPEPRLPDLDLPQSDLDLTMTFESILAESTAIAETITKVEPDVQKIHKRASNVLKLSQQNEKLKEELRAMNARIEAAERKQQELRQRAGRSQGDAAGGDS